LKVSNFEKVQHWAVDPEYEGQRLDNYLLSRLKGVPKSRIYRLIRKGEIRVDKKRVKPDARLQAGCTIRIPPIRVNQEKTDETAIAKLNKVNSLEQSVIYEDKTTLILNKPSGMAVHGGSGLSYGVIEALRAIRTESVYMELVHRLDKHTSGVLLIAKRRSALRAYQEQLRQKQMQKTYLAIVQGSWDAPDKVTVEAGLKKHLHASGERMVYIDSEGKRSVTRFERLASCGDFHLLRAMPVTGRTHQIRVHAKHIGVPLFGDEKYHPDYTNHRLNGKNCKRFFLHAASLSFRLYGTEQPFTARAALPSEFVSAIRALGIDYGVDNH
jgi:23S rRNA pseudouridine955/2504/2580 synthase